MVIARRALRWTAPRTLRALHVMALAAMLAACSPAPECDETISSLASYPVADQAWFDDSMTKLVPYSNRLTGSDTEFLRAACREDHWSASYRRCLRAARSKAEVILCRPESDDPPVLAWSTLPHEKAWLVAVADKAAEVMIAAADVARDKQQAAEQIEHRLADLDQALERARAPSPNARKIAEIEAERVDLRARLATARDAAVRAAALAKDCGFYPLEKPACLAAAAHPAAAK